jgi:integrase
MGHKSIVMTQRYAHLAPDQGAEVARLLSRILTNE